MKKNNLFGGDANLIYYQVQMHEELCPAVHHHNEQQNLSGFHHNQSHDHNHNDVIMKLFCSKTVSSGVIIDVDRSKAVSQ